ncbi:autophagy-related protein 16 [Pyronema domesticum]|uniref:Similar to Autophagy protein 16 acc. no. Q6BH63 n=1 Tax=Pyronema omphalodes (strain CBS 100304) TaxID=1076935 RepID=U4LHZ8_PYROM|nr:autophagy-related protein 16 [Pyronema domesticum]CCX31157.1 Similar to Autophagy protein 16; acc. no. Q6BH63 [Pyronema omphalodes CBS 100304]
MSTAATAWSVTFLKDLETRDRREKSYDDIISAYGALARQLHSKDARDAKDANSSPTATTTTTTATRVSGASTPTSGATVVGVTDDLTRLRLDFTLAQQQQSLLVTENRSLKQRLVSLQQTESEREKLSRRVKQLEEELKISERGRKMAQDEQVAQEIEVNLVYKQVEELRRDNKELVERWMELKREEAERMNEAMGM